MIEGEVRPTVTISGVPGVKPDRAIPDIAMTGGVKAGGAMTMIIVVIGRGNRRASGTVGATANGAKSKRAGQSGLFPNEERS